MKKGLVAILLVIIYGCSQKVIINGNVSAEQFKEHSVVINDTFTKADNSADWLTKDIRKLLSGKYHTTADRKGKFSIRAKRTDSLAFYSPGYKKQSYLVNDLAKKDTVLISLEKYPCDTVKCKEKPKYFIVAASKISTRGLHMEICPEILDTGSPYEAKYQVFNAGLPDSYTDENIKFRISVGHYPEVFNYKDVVLFLSESCGKINSFRGEFIGIYKTVDGRWATAYQIYAKSLTSVPIAFEQPVTFTVEDKDDEYINKYYPSPYYRIEGKKAIALYGYYLPDIVQARKASIQENYNITF